MRRDYIVDIFHDVFRLHGATHIDVPLFFTKTNTSNPRQVTTTGQEECLLLDQTGSILALRYDMRSYFCSKVAATLPMFKRYSIETIYRKSNKPALQPTRMQTADFDIVGLAFPYGDIECLLVAYEIMERFQEDVSWLRIRLCHAAIHRGVLETCEVPPSARPAVANVLKEVATSKTVPRTTTLSQLQKSGNLSERSVRLLTEWCLDRTVAGKDVLECVTDMIDFFGDHVEGRCGSFAADEMAAIKLALDESKKLKVFIECAQYTFGDRYKEREFVIDIGPPPSMCEGISWRFDVGWNAGGSGDTIAVGGRRDRLFLKNKRQKSMNVRSKPSKSDQFR